MKPKYNPKFSFKKNKKEAPKLKIDFVGVYDKEQNLGQSILYGKVELPKNKQVKKGCDAIDANETSKKLVTQNVDLLYLGNAPLKGLKLFLSD